jgi:hypothetical protein
VRNEDVALGEDAEESQYTRGRGSQGPHQNISLR